MMRHVLLAIIVAVWIESTSAVEPTKLFFSEYVEGSSNNKALEVYNPTSSPVALNQYRIKMFMNGATTTTATYTFSLHTSTLQSVNPGGVVVLCNTLINAAVLPKCNVTNSNLVFNGDDALTLWYDSSASFTGNEILLDTIGKVGVDPGTSWNITGAVSFTTLDHTLVRKATVSAPNADWDTAQLEWDVFNADDFGNLFGHSMSVTDPCASVSCGAHGTCSGGKCTCKDGYSGANCDVAPDPCSTMLQTCMSVYGEATKGDGVLPAQICEASRTALECARAAGDCAAQTVTNMEASVSQICGAGTGTGAPSGTGTGAPSGTGTGAPSGTGTGAPSDLCMDALNKCRPAKAPSAIQCEDVKTAKACAEQVADCAAAKTAWLENMKQQTASLNCAAVSPTEAPPAPTEAPPAPTDAPPAPTSKPSDVNLINGACALTGSTGVFALAGLAYLLA